MKVFIFCMYTSIKKSANSSSLWLSVSIAIVCYHTEVPLSLGDEACNKKDNSKYTGILKGCLLSPSLFLLLMTQVNIDPALKSCSKTLILA